MKKVFLLTAGVAFFFLGKAMASQDRVAGFGLIFLGLVLGGVFGALGVFCHLGGRHDLMRRFGATFIMIGGGMAVMGDPEKSAVFVPWFITGAVTGAIGCLLFFTSSHGDDVS